MRPPRKPAWCGFPRGAHRESPPPTLLEQRSASRPPAPFNKQSCCRAAHPSQPAPPRAAPLAARRRESLCPSMLGLAEHPRAKRRCTLAGWPVGWCNHFDLADCGSAALQGKRRSWWVQQPVEAAAGAAAHARGVAVGLGTSGPAPVQKDQIFSRHWPGHGQLRGGASMEKGASNQGRFSSHEAP